MFHQQWSPDSQSSSQLKELLDGTLNSKCPPSCLPRSKIWQPISQNGKHSEVDRHNHPHPHIYTHTCFQMSLSKKTFDWRHSVSCMSHICWHLSMDRDCWGGRNTERDSPSFPWVMCDSSIFTYYFSVPTQIRPFNIVDHLPLYHLQICLTNAGEISLMPYSQPPNTRR